MELENNVSEWRTAAQQALEALQVVLNNDYNLPYTKIVAAADALKAALAEPTVTVHYDLGAAETEEVIRQRLIELGWTPPKTEPTVKDSFTVEPLCTHPTFELSIGIDWGTDDGRPCCTVVRKLLDGTMEVIASEFGPAPEPSLAQRMRDAGYTRRETLREFIYRNRGMDDE